MAFSIANVARSIPARGELPAVGHQRRAFARADAVEPEDLVVGAGDQRVARFLIGLAVLPDPHPFQSDDRRFVVFRQCDTDAAAIAIDPTAKADFVAGVFDDDVAAVAAGVEVAGPVAIFDAKAERKISGLLVRGNFRRHQELHGADLLQGMLRQMLAVVAADETGIGLLAGRAGEHSDIERSRLGLVDAFLGVARRGEANHARGGGQREDPEPIHDIKSHTHHPSVARQAILTQREVLLAWRVKLWSRQARGTFNGNDVRREGSAKAPKTAIVFAGVCGILPAMAIPARAMVL
jgi:hypothetical protein